MSKKQIVIIGAGFAGVSTAWWLIQKGFQNITILEKEELPGMHSSGLNAGLARQLTFNSAITALAVEGAQFLLNPPKYWENRELINKTGSFLLFSAKDLPLVEQAINKSAALLDAKIISRGDVIAKIPVLKDAIFDHAVWTPTDGVVDIHAYLWSFIKDIKQGGAKLQTKHEVRQISQTQNGTYIISTNHGDIDADIIVNAAGGWASEIAELANASAIPLNTPKRHLFDTVPYTWIDRNWPFFWDISENYYCRPESSGLLLCACDKEDATAGSTAINPKAKESLAEKLSKYCPSLSDVRIAKEWCGIRTFTEDENFLIKQDPLNKQFFWVAALGGHGVTTAAAVGRIAAESILANI
jgi:D-arginine dehydrogenase